jgi:hypothetical protein
VTSKVQKIRGREIENLREKIIVKQPSLDLSLSRGFDVHAVD